MRFRSTQQAGDTVTDPLREEVIASGLVPIVRDGLAKAITQRAVENVWHKVVPLADEYLANKEDLDFDSALEERGIGKD